MPVPRRHAGDRVLADMEQPKPYLWDYDRNPWDQAGTAAETFSVGVYQWLPAAGGKGLKKSKSIRVNGYTTEPLKVYLKAQELCGRLNAESARAEDPPPWLRKQYSLPRPESLPAKEVHEGLTGDRARSIRLRVMKERLLPEGFRKGRGGTYVREAGEQFHLIDFQADRWGGEYFVNLGFHYTFLPSYSTGQVLPAAEFGPTHCAITARLGEAGNLVSDAFRYGEDPPALQELLERNARDALGLFERWAREWQNPGWWIAAAPGLRENPWVDGWLVRWPELIAGAAAVRLRTREVAAAVLAPLLAETAPEHVRGMARSILEE